MKVNKEVFREQVYQLYRKILKGDEIAKKDLIRIYDEKYPNNFYRFSKIDDNNLRDIYLHLTEN